MSKSKFAPVIRGSACVLAALALASLVSCVTIFTDQDTLRGYPYQNLRTLGNPDELSRSGYSKTAALAVPGLSFAASGNQAFPDLYCFVEKSQSAELSKALQESLPELLASGGMGSLGGTGKSLFNAVNQLLVYKANGGQQLQGVLIGRFPLELIRAGLLGQRDLKQRFITAGNGQQVYCFENGAGDLHIGLISDTFLVFQKDNQGTAAQNLNKFNAHVLRALSFSTGQFTPIVNTLAEKQEVLRATKEALQIVDTNGGETADPLIVPVELLNSSAVAFDQVLVNEKPRKALFAMASVAMPDSMPFTAVRLRVEPVKVKLTDVDTAAVTEVPLVDFQATLLPRSGMSAKLLKTGIKFGLMSFADIAGLDSDFLQRVAFTEQDGVLVITGLQVDAAKAGTLLGELVKLGGQAASGAPVWKADTTATEDAAAPASESPADGTAAP